MLSREEWDELVDEFFSSHPCQSLQVWTMPKELNEYVLIMHREPGSGKVHFTDLSPFYARMIEHLAENPVEMVDLIALTAQDFGLTVEKMVFENSLKFIDNALNSKLIIGFTN